MARILVVCDEPRIRTVLVEYLARDGHEVLEAGTGGSALQELGSGTMDLVLLDVGLPDMDGLEVLRRMRLTTGTPVILVTARAEEVDTIVGLAVGADDYITKPFSPREVVARVGAVLRRARHGADPDGGDDWIVHGPLAIHPGRREVRVDGHDVTLSALEFDILMALSSRPGYVLSRAQLLEKVWGYDFFGDERVVDVHIRSLRRALGDDANQPRLLATVRGVGYKLLARDR